MIFVRALNLLYKLINPLLHDHGILALNKNEHVNCLVVGWSVCGGLFLRILLPIKVHYWLSYNQSTNNNYKALYVNPFGPGYVSSEKG